MDFDKLTNDQIQKVFKLCDIMSMQDIYVAGSLLQNYGWDLQKTIEEIGYMKEIEQKKEYHVHNINVNNNYNNSNKNQNKNQNLINKIQQQKSNIDNKNINNNQSNHINQNNHFNNYNNNNYNYDQSFNYDDDPYMLHQDQQQEYIDYEDYEYDFAKINDFQKKKQMFNQNYASQIPLTKTLSEQQPRNMIRDLEKDKKLAEGFKWHRNQYQSNLLENSQKLLSKILQKSLINKKSLQNYHQSNQKIQKNKKFIVYLHKVYKSKINFTFGTFLLNLIRSYLDDKYLLVFLLNNNNMNTNHNHGNNENNINKLLQRLLTQHDVSKFVNRHCVSYGIFDNSDDYQIIQKYVPLKDFPAFALFKYDKKQLKEKLIGAYPILGKQTQNCLEWMAKQMGVNLKKKQIQKINEEDKKFKERLEYQNLSDILYDQNLQYEQMQKIYKLKRLQSKLNKDKIKQKQQQIQGLKKYFQAHPEPEFFPQKTIMIKFRMPMTGQSKIRVFGQQQKISILFDYVKCYHQDEFEDKHCQFDLTQTFPSLSLKDKRDQLIKNIFEGSQRQNLIVKEI